MRRRTNVLLAVLTVAVFGALFVVTFYCDIKRALGFPTTYCSRSRD